MAIPPGGAGTPASEAVAPRDPLAGAGTGRRGVPPSSPAAGPRAPAAEAVALVALGTVLLSTAIEILPPDPVFGRFTLGRLILVAALVALVAGGARLRDFRTPLDAPILLLLLISAATTQFGGHSGAPLRFVLTAVAFFYATVALWRRSPESRGALALVALVTIVASAAAGVEQVAQDRPTDFYRDGLTPVQTRTQRPDLLVRAIGTFANPNLLASHVVLLAPLGALAVLFTRGRGTRTILGALVALAYLGLVVTFSRAGVAAALIGAGAVAAALRPLWRPWLLLAGLVVAILLLLSVLIGGGNLLAGFGRPEAWALSLQVWADNPLFGVGLGRAGDVMNAVGGEDVPFRHAHNLWLTWLADAGPLAMLAWVWIALALVLRAFSDAAAGSRTAAAGLAALAAFFAFSLVDHPANVERIAMCLFFVAGVVAAAGPASFWPFDGTSQGATKRSATVRRLAADAARRGRAGTRGRRSASGSHEDGRRGAARSRRMRSSAAAVAAALLLGACNGDPEPAQSPPGGAGEDGAAPAEREGGAGDEVPIRAQAEITGRRGRLSPQVVEVPPFVSLRVVLKSADGGDYRVEIEGQTLRAWPERPQDSVLLEGLSPGARYVARGEGGRVLIVASAEPGP